MTQPCVMTQVCHNITLLSTSYMEKSENLNMEQEDRRIKRSRNLLLTAFQDLINEKEFQTITVKEVTDRADVGQRTFYRHFENLEDMMLYLVIHRYEVFQERMIPFGNTESNQINGTRLFEYVNEHESFFRVLFRSRINDKLIPVLCQNATQAASVLVEMKKENPVLLDMLLNQVISSLFALIEWWLTRDRPYTPQRMGEIYSDLIIHPCLNEYLKD